MEENLGGGNIGVDFELICSQDGQDVTEPSNMCMYGSGWFFRPEAKLKITEKDPDWVT